VTTRAVEASAATGGATGGRGSSAAVGAMVLLRNSRGAGGRGDLSGRGGGGGAAAALGEFARQLRRASSELWLVLLLKALESYSFFALSQVLVLFLTAEFHLDDRSAGSWYGAYGALVSVYGVLLARGVDKMGVVRTLRVGLLVSACSRLWLALGRTRSALAFNLFVALPMAAAAGIPVLSIAVKRLTDDGNRAVAMGLFYIAYNVGALLSGVVVDTLSIWVKVPGLSSERVVLLSCAAASFIALAISTLSFKDPRLAVVSAQPLALSPLDSDSGADAVAVAVGSGSGGGISNSTASSGGGGSSSSRPRLDSSFASSAASLLRDGTFRRFFAVSVLLVNLRSLVSRSLSSGGKTRERSC
jgi:hypothetical protein